MSTTRLNDGQPETVDSYQGYVGFANAGVTTNQGARIFGNGTPVKTMTTTPTLSPSRAPTASSPATASTMIRCATAPQPRRSPCCPASSITPWPCRCPAVNLTTLWNGAATGNLTVTFTHDGQLHEHLVEGRQDHDDRQPRRAPR